MVKAYLEIQRIRFHDCFSVEYEIERQIEQVRIVKFILQPIVENAVVHGLEGVDGTGYIRIHIYEKINGTEGTAVQGDTDSGDGCLIIEVSDNGHGMTKKQLEEVRNSLKEDSISKHSSIGMSNIDQRIKLCYGNGYGVNIDSVEGEGTMVTVILPNKSKN